MIAVLLGYVASVLLALSLLVSNELRFRWLNLFGCLSFIVYGILINAFPIILTNTILLLINAVSLVKTYRRHELFDLLEFGVGDQIVEKFVAFYRKDIDGYFPQFSLEVKESQVRFVTLRDMVIANIFIADVANDGTAVVRINYTVPKYRDYKVGTFIFQKEKRFLQAKGIKRIVYTEVANKRHLQFLQRMGFRHEGTEMVRDIN